MFYRITSGERQYIRLGAFWGDGMVDKEKRVLSALSVVRQVLDEGFVVWARVVFLLCFVRHSINIKEHLL